MRWVPFAYLTCPHTPFQNEDSVAWALKTLADLKPRPRRLYMGGDVFDANAASRHPNAHDIELEAEYESGARLLASLREAVPYRCSYRWTLGNHEDNILVLDERRIDKRLHSLVHWNKSPFKDEFMRWRQFPYIKSAEGCDQLGQVIFIHGFDCGVTSDDLEALQFAGTILGGRAHRLVIRGHTHHPVAVTQCLRTRTVPLPFWYANAGTLGPLQPLYMTRKSAFRWGPAIVFGEADPRPNYTRGGRQWTAVTLTPEGAL